MKNRMRKLLVLATAATLMTTAFTGCGQTIQILIIKQIQAQAQMQIQIADHQMPT